MGTSMNPKMAKAASAPELRDAFEKHLEETRGQVARLEAIFADMTLPEHFQDWLALNAEAQDHPVISGKIPALFGPTCKGKPE